MGRTESESSLPERNVHLELHPVQLLQDPNTVLTPRLFELLASELGVRWPVWFRTIMTILMEHEGIYPYWLPGGFLYRMPKNALEETRDFQSGERKVWRIVGPPRGLEPASWVPTHAVVGAHGGGRVVIDTANTEPVFYDLSNDDLCLRPFISIREHFGTPEEFARALIGQQIAMSEKMQEEARRSYDTPLSRNPGTSP